MLARNRLTLRLLVRAKWSWRFAGQYCVAAASGTGADMQPLQRVDARLQRWRQRRIGGCAIGEQRLSLATWHWLHSEKERNVRRGATVALISVPAAPVWELYRQAAIGTERWIW